MVRVVILPILHSNRISCHASVWGGAVKVQVGSGVIEGSVFTDCSSGYYGGAVYLGSGAHVLLRDSHITSCAAVRGGAVMVEESCAVNATRVLVEDCFAGNDGGAFTGVLQAQIHIVSSRLLRNNARQRGGAIFAELGVVSVA